MTDNKKTPGRDEAQQVIRQFAWNLAGTLARSKTAGPARRLPARNGNKDKNGK